MHKENFSSLSHPILLFSTPILRINLILLTYFALLLHLGAQTERFEFTELLTKAYLKSTSLELDNATLLLEKSHQQDPNNYLNELVADYIDFFKIFINQDRTQLQRLEPRKSIRIERLRQCKIESPYRLYALAEINLHWGLIYLQDGSYLSAYAHIKRAYKYLTKNQKAWPEFVNNYKSLGILHATVGSIPKHFRKIFSFFSGMRGTIDQGKRELLILIDYIKKHPDYLFKDETYTLYTLLLVHLNNEGEEAWELIQQFPFTQDLSPLLTFCKANIAMRTYRNDEALQILNHNASTPAQWPFWYLEFMSGLSKLRKLDPGARIHFQQFIEESRGTNYKKEAYQKLAWLDLIENNISGYHKMMQAVERYGDDQIDGDKNAIKEAKASLQGVIPDRDLLKARLLFDGGYFDQALAVLLSVRERLLQDSELKLEFHYRLARTYHLQGGLPQALKEYQLTIDEGIYSSAYYACSSALQMGLIYEDLGDQTKARKFFKYCLSIHPQDYRTSLHMKAEAGLNRVK